VSRIAIAIQNDDLHTGIGQYIANIFPALSEDGHDVVAVAHKKNELNVPLPLVRSKLSYRLVYDNALFGSLCPVPYEKLAGVGKCDLAIFPDNRMPAARVGCPTVAVIHDLMPLRLTDFMRAEGHGAHWFRTYRRRYRRIADRADCICAVSEYTRQDIIKEFGVDPDRVAVVSPGVDYERFAARDTERDAEVRKRLNLPERYLLYFGNMCAYKNLSGLIRAYARLPRRIVDKIPLVVSCRSNENAVLAQSLGVGNRVRFLGGVQEADKPSVFRLATVFGFLSYFEGFGIPVVEAMASGVPCVVSNCASLPEVVGEAGLIVPPDDEVKASEALEVALTDVAERERMVVAGRTRAAECSWRLSADKMKTLVAEMLNEKI